MRMVFEQVLLLFLFVAVGFLLCRLRIVKEEQAGILSSLLVYLFFPCKIFRTFAEDLTLDFLAAHWQIPVISLALTVFCAVAMHFAAKVMTKQAYERSVIEYSLVVPNYAYMGYALTEALLGTEGLVAYMLFTLPITLYIYTVGFSLLTKWGFSPRKLLNPVTVALLLGLAAMFTGLKLPGVLSSMLQKSAACLAPVSMLLTGIVIAGFPIRDILQNRNVYLVSLLRLVVLPLAVGLVLSRFCAPEVSAVAILLYALPCGLNTVVFPRLIGEDCRLGAGLAMISCILTCFTIPLICRIFQIGG